MKKNLFKFLLVGFVVISVGLTCFSDAKTVSNKDTGMDDLFGFNRQYKNGYWDISPATPGTITCAFLNTNNNGGTFYDGTNSYPLQGYASYCTDSTTVSITTNSSYEVFVITVGEDMKDQFFPQYTSLQCQTAYSLIPVSSVTTSYCKTNFGLIDPSECSCGDSPECPSAGTSNLFINDIYHPGAYNIIMNIPEEIDWDYAYTNSGTNFNLDVIGYNQDTEYINGLIDINNYKPTSDDFSNVFLLFKDYSGLILACLFVILVFYLVKKSF